MIRKLTHRLEWSYRPVMAIGRDEAEKVARALQSAEVYSHAVATQDPEGSYELYTDKEYSARYLRTLGRKAMRILHDIRQWR